MSDRHVSTLRIPRALLATLSCAFTLPIEFHNDLHLLWDSIRENGSLCGFPGLNFRMNTRRKERKGIAAVEAAVCLPILVVIWLGSFEVLQILALKQQGQLLSSTAAQRVVASADSFNDIEARVLSMSEAIGINDCEVEIQRVDPDLVESIVTIDLAKNSPSPLGSLFNHQSVSSHYFAFRKE